MTTDREVLADLIAAVRTLANHTLTLHLQLGAVRTLLVAKGTVSNAELSAAMAELGAMATVNELSDPDLPNPDDVFDDLLRRLQVSSLDDPPPSSLS